jgi:hypothetical protein
VRSGVPGVPERGSTCRSAHFGPDGRADATFAISHMPRATRLGISGRDARSDRSARPSSAGRGGRRAPRAAKTCTTAHFDPNSGAVYHFARHTCPGVTRLENPRRKAHFDRSAGPPRPLPKPIARPPASPSRAAPSHHSHLASQRSTAPRASGPLGIRPRLIGPRASHPAPPPALGQSRNTSVRALCASHPAPKPVFKTEATPPAFHVFSPGETPERPLQP